MKQPYARTYAKGRPTNGWERGELITTLADLQPGDVLIRVSHQFQAENLIRVVPLPEGFSPINSDRGFYYEYVDCRNCERSDGSLRSLREITSAFAYAGRLREEVPRVNELGGPSDESLSGGY